MPKSIFVYLVALFFLTGSILFITSFFLNSSDNEIENVNSEIIFEAKNISINLGFKDSNLNLKVKSSMVNSLKEEKNLYVYKPEIGLSGKNIDLKITSDNGKISYDKNIIQIENNILVNGEANGKAIKGSSDPININLNQKNLSSEKLILFIDEYKILLNEIILENEEMVLKGNPIYLIDNEGLETETSMIRLKSNGELFFPNKLKIRDLN
tara:strand:- start:3176 stop:3808 length:633 start_codon:yes stop_codon:yes gene_type:complete